jgi:orotate phosphoribosyltransferase
MDTIERETIVIVYESKKASAEVEKVIIFKDRETAIDAFFGEYQGRSVLTMAEVNREVKQVQPSVVQESLPGLDDGEDTLIIGGEGW